MAFIIDTAILVCIRLALFLSCRKFLLNSLYSDLRHLSSPSSGTGILGPPGTPTTEVDDHEYIQLDTLPTPVSSHGTGPGGLERQRTARPRALHSTISRALFSSCFSECCMLFVLLMAQGVEVFEPRTRLAHWKFSISFLLIAVLILTPLFVSLVISLGSSGAGTEGSSSERGPKRILTPRFFLNFLPLLIYLYFLSLVPIPSGLTSSDLFSITLARLVVLGTIILGLLSGVGAVAALEEYLGLFGRNKSEPTAREIESAERALQKVRDDLRSRREEARRASDSPTTSSWMSRVVPKFTGGDGLTLEIKGMEALEYEMSQNLDDLHRRHERAKFASTFRGRLLGVFGKIFAAYCVVRIISSLVSLITPHFLLAITKHDQPTHATNYPDLLAKLVGDLLSLTSENKVDVEAVGSVMRQISLGLVGLIILNSLRLVLRGVTRALRVTSRNVSASLMVLILAQLMGLYLLSTVVQLRNLFPPVASDSEETSNLFSTIPEFQVFGKLFDGSFLLAAGCLGLFRWFRERISGAPDGI